MVTLTLNPSTVTRQLYNEEEKEFKYQLLIENKGRDKSKC